MPFKNNPKFLDLLYTSIYIRLVVLEFVTCDEVWGIKVLHPLSKYLVASLPKDRGGGPVGRGRQK